MKYIGTTPDDGVIVEFLPGEYKQFLKARDAAKGVSVFDDYYGGSQGENRIASNMTQFFTALSVFCDAKFRINELRRCTKRLEGVLGIKTPPDDLKTMTPDC